jgi:hypothetical protein
MPLNLSGAGTPPFLNANDKSQIIFDTTIRLHHERRLADFLLPISVHEYEMLYFFISFSLSILVSVLSGGLIEGIHVLFVAVILPPPTGIFLPEQVVQYPCLTAAQM